MSAIGSQSAKGGYVGGGGSGSSGGSDSLGIEHREPAELEGGRRAGRVGVFIDADERRVVQCDCPKLDREALAGVDLSRPPGHAVALLAVAARNGSTADVSGSTVKKYTMTGAPRDAVHYDIHRARFGFLPAEGDTEPAVPRRAAGAGTVAEWIVRLYAVRDNAVIRER